MPLPSHDELVSEKLPSYEDLTALPSYDELTAQPVDPGEPQTAADLMSGRFTDEQRREAMKRIRIPTMADTGAIPAKVIEPILKYTTPLGFANQAAEMVAPNSTAAKATEGVITGASEALSGFTTPEGLSQLAIMPQSKIGQIVLNLGFGGKALSEVPEQVKAYGAADDPTEKAKIATNIAVSLGLPAVGLTHGLMREPVPNESRPSADQATPNIAESSNLSPQTEAVESELSLPQRPPVTLESLQSETAIARDVPEVPQPEITTPIVEPDAGYDGIRWKDSKIDLRSTDSPHTVAVIFHKEPLRFAKSPQGNRVERVAARPANEAPVLEAPSVPEPNEAGAPPVPAREETAPTSTKNEVTNVERENRGIAPAVEAARRDFGSVWDSAEETAKADPTAPERLATEIAANPRALSDHENALLLRRQIEVQNEHDAAIKAVNEAPDETARADASVRLERARDDLQTVYDAAKSAGTETGRGLNARKMLANNNYSLAKMEATTRAVVNNGKALTERQAVDVKGLHDRIRAAEEKLSAYEAREQFETELRKAKAEARKTGFKPQSFLEQQALKARERIISRRGKLHADPIGIVQVAHLADEAIIGASHIARGVTKFADWSAQMIADFGERIKPHLQALYAKARELHAKAGNRTLLTAEERQQRGLEGDKKRIQTRIEQIQEKTAAGDFTKPEKRPPRMDKEKANLLFEFQKAKQAYDRGLFEARLSQQSVPRKIFRTGGEIVNTARALNTSYDLSAVLRQGGLIALGHPIRALKSFPDMIRAFGSERVQHRINAEIMSRPNAPLYAQAKLFLVDESATSLSKMEEAFMSRWAGKIPLVGASQRAYTTFLNKLRADSFDAMTGSLGRNGKVTLPEARAIANYVNIATGRGDISLMPQAGVALNTIFFAPRLVISRFQFLAGQPFYRGTMRTRGLILKEYARFLTGAATVYALGMAAGGKLDASDPSSPDFGKLQFGNTRIDLLSGLQQATVFSARELQAVRRFIVGEKKNPKYGSGGDVLYRFLRTKLAPVPGATVNAISGKNVVGERVTPKSVAVDLVTPMSLRDIKETMEEQGLPKGAALGVLSVFGAGVQTYDAKKKR